MTREARIRILRRQRRFVIARLARQAKWFRASHFEPCVFRERFKNIFGKQRNRIEGDAERVFNGVDNGGRGTVHGKFADSFCAVRAMNVAQFLEEDANGRKIGGGVA